MRRNFYFLGVFILVDDRAVTNENVIAFFPLRCCCLIARERRLKHADCSSQVSTVADHHRETVFYRLIVGLSESLIASPVHPLRLGRKVIKNA